MYQITNTKERRVQVKNKLWFSILVMVLLAGCTMVVDPNFQPQARSGQIEPGAGQWQTWVLASGDELRPAAPPDQAATMAEIAELKTMASEIDADTEAIVAYWD